MKKIIGFLMLLFTFSLTAVAEENIAVFPFENKVEQDYNITELAENEMTSLLVNQKRFDVIERKELNKILEEQHLSNSGIVDINQALQIGKIKGIRYGVFGQITNISYTNKDLALITLQLKIVDMETANIVFSKVYNARPKDEKSDDKETVLTNTLKEKFKKEISNDLINTFTIEGNIVDVDGKKVTIDVGSKEGVVRGMEFNVIESQEKISKSNKKVKIEKAKALLEVIEVHDETSLCKFKEGEKLEEGMSVKLVQVDENRYYKAEDVEKLLTRRGIQKGDLLVSVYGGTGSYSADKNPKEIGITVLGAESLVFVKSWLGLGLSGMVKIDSGEEYWSSGGVANYKNWNNGTWGTDSYDSGEMFETGKLYSCSITNIMLAGRINLNNSNFRLYIPFGIGIVFLKDTTDTLWTSNRRYGNPVQNEHKEWKEKEKEQNEKAEICYSLGIGIERNITNNFSLGLEGRFNTPLTDYKFPVILLKLNYKFEELIKFNN